MGKTRNVEEPNHWSDIVGMPDAWDKKNIATLIEQFKKETFTHGNLSMLGEQWIRNEIRDAKQQHQAEGVGADQFGLKSKGSDLRVGTAMPNVLWERIQEAYPTMFRDKEHFGWFVKNFPEFRVARRF